MRSGMKLGALGGPNTFGGDAARRVMELYPEFVECLYFPTAEEGFAFADGAVDAMVAPQQMARTGCHPGIQALVAGPQAKLHVIAEIKHEYHCSLIGKPGTKLSDIRRIVGHTGSLSQSQAWLAENLPQAEIVNLHTSTQGAAQAVTDGDGSTASVGTPGMAGQFALEELAKDIDGGSVGAYWVISPEAQFSDMPTRLVLTGRFGDDGSLGDLIAAIGDWGGALQTVYGQASGDRLYEYDYVVRAAGGMTLKQVTAGVSQFPQVRLTGAFEIRE